MLEENKIRRINIYLEMDRTIYVLAALAQIVYLVSAQDYCGQQCQDIPEHVVCTCVECPEHGTCEAGEIACEKENPVCDTTAIEHVCPTSTVCVPENCECKYRNMYIDSKT